MAALVITELPFISEPVAGRVRMAPRGIALVTGACFARISQGSPSKLAAAAINLVPSRTEPPPTAKRKSTLAVRTSSTALSKVSRVGLGSIPPNSIRSRPAKAA